MDEPALHPDIEHLSFLLGRWAGEGKGEYPTVEPFAYREEVLFAHRGKPFLAYVQRTWRLPGDEPSHSEAGYLRPVGTDRLELVLAHPTGVVEIEEGSLQGTTLALRTSNSTAASSVYRYTASAHLPVRGKP